jgi:short-subunit dehydrogenase
MNSLIIGASAGVGRALSEELASRGKNLLLVATDSRDLQALASHLRLNYEVEVISVVADAANVEDCVEMIRLAAIELGNFDSLYFPIGISSSEDCGYMSMEKSGVLLNINLTIVISVITVFLPEFLILHKANIVGFGSIASVRGRRSNIVYSAAKRALESYFESLRHLLVGSRVTVQFYKLGYVATQQSFGKNLLFPAASPRQIAIEVLSNSNKDIGTKYLPKYWVLICTVVRLIPWALFKKMNF